MKAVYTFILIFSVKSLCQETLPMLEISTRTSGFDDSTRIRFHLDPIGTAWCLSNQTFYIDNNKTHAEEIVYGNHTQSPFDKGFNVCYNNQGWELFWLCFYKMTIYIKEFGKEEVKRTHFYIDFRDCNYGINMRCSGVYDISIKIDNYTGLYYASGLGTNYYPFDEGVILNWWEINNCNSHCTADLPSYWQNCLVIIPDESETHPRLVWGPHPTMQNIIYYGVFRGVSPDGSIPPSLNEFS